MSMFAQAGVLEEAGLRRILIFRVGEALCGLDILSVQEVLRNPHLTKVYTAPGDVGGVINLRGRIVTILDLVRRMGVERAETRSRWSTVVVQDGAELIGLLVDSVEDIISAREEEFRPPPPHLPADISQYTLAVLPGEGEAVVVLDTARLVS